MWRAVEGGLFTLIFFMAIFWQCFRLSGVGQRSGRAQKDRKLELEIWSFGAALMATLAAYFGITYFDQSSLSGALLAMIGAITSTALARVPPPRKAGERSAVGAGASSTGRCRGSGSTRRETVWKTGD